MAPFQVVAYDASDVRFNAATVDVMPIRVDVNALLDRVDVNALVDRVDIDRMLDGAR